MYLTFRGVFISGVEMALSANFSYSSTGAQANHSRCKLCSLSVKMKRTLISPVGQLPRQLNRPLLSMTRQLGR